MSKTSNGTISKCFSNLTENAKLQTLVELPVTLQSLLQVIPYAADHQSAVENWLVIRRGSNHLVSALWSTCFVHALLFALRSIRCLTIPQHPRSLLRSRVAPLEVGILARHEQRASIRQTSKLKPDGN